MVVRLTADMRLSFADGLFWSSVACCAIAQFFILRSVGGGGGGRRPTPDASGSGVPQPRGMLEMFWAVVPALALVVLLTVTWRAMRDRAEPAASSAQSLKAER
jgi:heme/copper-type cytochrome/quinol oxidase subunit 2